MTHRRNNRNKGYAVAELPAAIFVLLLVLALPLLNLCTITMRATTVYTAARNGARAAGRALTFSENVRRRGSGTAQLAVLQALKSGASGVSISPRDVKVLIIGMPLKSGLPEIRQAQRLRSIEPADYVYQIEVTVTGQVQPFIALNPGIFGKIPGLTTPLRITASFREIAEHLEGLTE